MSEEVCARSLICIEMANCVASKYANRPGRWYVGWDASREREEA